MVKYQSNEGKLFIALVLISLNVRAANMVVTNEIDGTVDASSYDTPPYAGLVFGYFTSGFFNMYPQFTNSLVSVSRGGASLQNQYEQQQPKYSPGPFALARTNGVVAYDFILANDNGSYDSNTVYTYSTSLFGALTNVYNGTATTNEGFQIPIQHYMLGANVASVSGGDGGSVARNAAAMQRNLDSGSPAVDLWHDNNTNGMNSNLTDVSGNYWFFALGHLTPKTALAVCIAWWRGLGLETNVGSITFDVANAQCSASNKFAATGISWDGAKFSCTLKADRMPPSWDISACVSNQVATTLWGDMPTYGAVFQWTLKLTNMPVHATYNVKIDGVTIAQLTDTQLAAGYNLATNDVVSNPFNQQRTAVLYSIRDKYGVDHTTLLATHNAGSSGLFGRDLINFQSDASGLWPATHGPALVQNSQYWADIMSMRTNYDVRTFNAAQQTNHTLTVTAQSAVNATTMTIGTTHWGQ